MMILCMIENNFVWLLVELLNIIDMILHNNNNNNNNYKRWTYLPWKYE